jgi:predicted DNA binding protein
MLAEGVSTPVGRGSHIHSPLPRLHLYEFSVGSTRNSMFGALSQVLATRIGILVVRVSGELYLTLASVDLGSFDMHRFREVYGAFKRNLLGVHVDRRRSSVAVVAAKYRCPFYEIVESSGAVLIPMYTYDRGVRRFFIAGPPDMAERLFDNLREVYRSVSVRRTRWSEVFEEYRRQTLLSVLSTLTDRQRTILEVAYRKGFFDDVRRVGLEEFSEVVRGSKSSVSVTIRRALRKILAELYSAV